MFQIFKRTASNTIYKTVDFAKYNTAERDGAEDTRRGS